jgi:hypothetical protein
LRTARKAGLSGTGEGGDAQFTVTSSVANAVIAAKGNQTWAIQLFQEGIAVEAGKNYELTFDMWSTAARPVILEYGGRPGNPQVPFNLPTTEGTSHKHQFTASAAAT